MSSKVRLQWLLRCSTVIKIHQVVIRVVRILRSIDRANLNSWRPSYVVVPISIPQYKLPPHWHKGKSRFSIILKKLSINSHLEIWGAWHLHFAGMLASPFRIIPPLDSTRRLFFKKICSDN